MTEQELDGRRIKVQNLLHLLSYQTPLRTPSGRPEFSAKDNVI